MLKLNRSEQKPKGNIVTLIQNYFRRTGVAVGPRAGLTKLWHAAFPAVLTLFYFFSPTSVSIGYHAEYVYTHISDCVETEYQLTLLPNNTASEMFLHRSGAMRRVD